MNLQTQESRLQMQANDIKWLYEDKKEVGWWGHPTQIVVRAHNYLCETSASRQKKLGKKKRVGSAIAEISTGDREMCEKKSCVEC